MNINEINDLQVLKAMAYDQIAAKEKALQTLAEINNRITVLENNPSVNKLETVVDSSDKPKA